MLKISNIFKHLKLICRHKYYVCKYCFKFGLYRQGLVHDLSKFSLTEFWTSVKYYQGNRSPVNAEKEDKGYSEAWLHHYHRNKHHWMYWIDFDNKQNIVPIKIPYNYLIESIADWIAAGIVYEKDKFTWEEPYTFYKNNIRINNEISSKIFHPQTRLLYDKILLDLKNNGIDYITYNIRKGYYKDLYNTKCETHSLITEELNENNYIINKYYTTNSEKDKLIYIFLDVDGVLNNQQYIEYCYENNGHKPMYMSNVPFDPKCVNNLMYLINYIQSKGYITRIILTSTWRLHKTDLEIVESRLCEYGLTIYDKTPHINSERGKEIQEYLDTSNICCYYLIIDDDMFDIINVHNKHNIIRTYFKKGFDQYALFESIDKFNNFRKEEQNGTRGQNSN